MDCATKLGEVHLPNRRGEAARTAKRRSVFAVIPTETAVQSPRPACRRGTDLLSASAQARFSNRKFPLLESGVSHRKQTMAISSNRQFSRAPYFTLTRPQLERNLPGTPFRVDFGLTHSKQRTAIQVTRNWKRAQGITSHQERITPHGILFRRIKCHTVSSKFPRNPLKTLLRRHNHSTQNSASIISTVDGQNCASARIAL